MKGLLLTLGFMVSSFAQAATMIASFNQELSIPINLELGSILQLPAAVKTVTPSKYFHIQDVGSAEAKADVKTFHITPIKSAIPETVTFVLANGKALSLKLVPAAAVDKFYDIALESMQRKPYEAKFLSSEMAMMRAMLLDEAAGFTRELVDEKDEKASLKSPIDELSFRLLRVYSATELTGYVFKVFNRSAEPIALNLSGLGFAKPNRAVLAHADYLQLEPCPKLFTATTECQTALRLVVRGPKPPQPVFAATRQPPFTKLERSLR